jgi:hypothetical protein
MVPDLRTAVATEYQKDLRLAADRRRLAAAAAPPAALRLRLGRRLGLNRMPISGPSKALRHPTGSFIGKEEGWKSS